MSLKSKIFSSDYEVNGQNIVSKGGCGFAMRRCGKDIDACRGIEYGAGQLYARASLCSCVKNCLQCLGMTTLTKSVENQQEERCKSLYDRNAVDIYNSGLIPKKYSEADLGRFSNFSGNGKAIFQSIVKWLGDSTVDSKAAGDNKLGDGRATDTSNVMSSGRLSPSTVRKGFDLNKKGFLLTGAVGVGKTYLLTAIAKELAGRGVSFKFIDFNFFLYQLRGTYSQQSNENELDHLRPLIECDVLIIDEFAKDLKTKWNLSILDYLVTSRYNSSKMIIGSTNYSVAANSSTANSALGGQSANFERDEAFSGNRSNTGSIFAKPLGRNSDMHENIYEDLSTVVGDRLYSRLTEMVDFIEFRGKDYRPLFK